MEKRDREFTDMEIEGIPFTADDLAVLHGEGVTAVDLQNMEASDRSRIKTAVQQDGMNRYPEISRIDTRGNLRRTIAEIRQTITAI